MATLSQLRSDIEALKARSGAGAQVPADRVEFARLAGLEPDDWQRRALASDAPRQLYNCSRQSGKSSVAAVLALHRALYIPGSLVLCLAPALRQSQELFAKVAGFYRSLDNPVPPHADRRLSLELVNGSRVITLPGSEKTIRGFSGASLLLVDEAARVEDSLYHAVRPMLAVSGGDLVLMSTPAGKRGVFFEAWSEGSQWERYEVPATEVPRIPPEFLAEERAALPDRVFRAEYMCSFEDVDDAVFSFETVEAAVTGEVAPLWAC